MNKPNNIRKKALDFAKKRQWDKALNEYIRLAEIEANNPNVFNELGDLHLKLGHKNDAFNAFHSAIDAYTKLRLHNNAVAVCKKIIRLNAADRSVYGKLAKLRHAQGFKKEAVTYAVSFLEKILQDGAHDPETAKAEVTDLASAMNDSPEVLERAANCLLTWEFVAEGGELFEKLARLYLARGMAPEAQRAQDQMAATGHVPSSPITAATPSEPKPATAESPPAPAAKSTGGADSKAPNPASPSPATTPDAATATPAAAPNAAGAASATAKAEPPGDGESFVESHRFDPAKGQPQSTRHGGQKSAPNSRAVYDFDTVELDSGAGQTATATEPAEPKPETQKTPPTPAAKPTKAPTTAEAPAPPPTDESANDADADHIVPEADSPTEEKALPSGGKGADRDPTDAPTSGESSAGPPSGLSDDEVRVPTEDLPDGLEETDDGSGVVHVADLVNHFNAEVKADVDAEDYRSHYDLGMAYLEMDLITEAVREFQFASASSMYQVRCLELIGLCFIRQNQPRLAIKQLEKGLALVGDIDRDSIGLQYNLGLAYEMEGNDAKAKNCFEEVYVIDVTFRDVTEKMQKYSAK